MRINDSNMPLRRNAGILRPATQPPAPATLSRALGEDRYLSSSPLAEPAGDAAKAELRRQKEEEKARWRRIMLILLAGFKPSASGADVMIDVVDAKNQERRSSLR